MEALARLGYLGLSKVSTPAKVEVDQVLLLGKEDVLNWPEINKKALE
jgi:hypothetical protein